MRRRAAVRLRTRTRVPRNRARRVAPLVAPGIERRHDRAGRDVGEHGRVGTPSGSELRADLVGPAVVDRSAGRGTVGRGRRQHAADPHQRERADGAADAQPQRRRDVDARRSSASTSACMSGARSGSLPCPREHAADPTRDLAPTPGAAGSDVRTRANGLGRPDRRTGPARLGDAVPACSVPVRRRTDRGAAGCCDRRCRGPWPTEADGYRSRPARLGRVRSRRRARDRRRRQQVAGLKSRTEPDACARRESAPARDRPTIRPPAGPSLTTCARWCPRRAHRERPAPSTRPRARYDVGWESRTSPAPPAHPSGAIAVTDLVHLQRDTTRQHYRRSYTTPRAPSPILRTRR